MRIDSGELRARLRNNPDALAAIEEVEAIHKRLGESEQVEMALTYGYDQMNIIGGIRITDPRVVALLSEPQGRFDLTRMIAWKTGGGTQLIGMAILPMMAVESGGQVSPPSSLPSQPTAHVLTGHFGATAQIPEYEREGHGYTTLSREDFEKERGFGYCLYEDPNEPTRRCHRKFGHNDERGHSEFPVAGDHKRAKPTDEPPCGCMGGGA
jgi:hypothetical protein